MSKTFLIKFNGVSTNKGYLIPVNNYVQFDFENEELSKRSFTITTNYDLRNTDLSKYRQLASFTEKVLLQKEGHYEFRVCEKGHSGDDVKSIFVKVTSESYPNVLGMTVQTIIPKLMGDYHDWERHFALAANTGYNAIHLTPIHVLGCSNSAYCIGDNFDVIHSLFPSNESMPTTSSARLAFFSKLLIKARKDYHLKFFGDIVIPQVGVDSALVRSNPDACYSLHACPYLKPAFVLDMGIRVFFEPIAGKLTSEKLVDSYVNEFRLTTYQGLRLWEFYAFDVARELARFDKLASHDFDQSYDVIKQKNNVNASKNNLINSSSSLSGMNAEAMADMVVATAAVDEAWERWPKSIDFQVLKLFRGQREKLEKALNDANVRLYAEYDDDTAAVMDHLRGGLKYEFLAAGGGRAIPRYFCLISPESAYTVDVLGNLGGITAIANHGWVMNGSADVDYAGPGSKAYIRRELIPWCDTAKLRYGSERASNPALWDFMGRYVELMADIFDGFRIDNCHSIPIHILKYLLQRARSANPKLLVFAELFSSMEHKVEYVAACGIDALVKEVGKNGGGSFYEYISAVSDTCGAWYSSVPAAPAQMPVSGKSGDEKVYLPREAPVIDWAYDQTHDNQALPELRGSLNDVNALTATLAMCKTPVGSMRGVDELYLHEVNVVHERRRFNPFLNINKNSSKNEISKNNNSSKNENAKINNLNGIMRARKCYNELHSRLDREGFDTVRVERIPYGDHINGLIISRINSSTFEKVVLIALSSLHTPSDYAPLNGWLVDVYGSFEKVLFLSSLSARAPDGTFSDVTEQYLSGVPCDLTLFEEPALGDLDRFLSISRKDDATTRISFREFPAGSVVCLKMSLPAAARAAWNAAVSEVATPEYAARSLAGVSLCDMNVLLYRCPSEEHDDYPDDVYQIPGYGDLVYHGLQGWADALTSVLQRPVISGSDPVVRNVSDGLWGVRNMIKRAGKPGLEKVRDEYLVRVSQILENLPVALRFRVFNDVIMNLYETAVKKCVGMMSPFVQNGSKFVKELALGSVMFYGRVEKAPLVDSKLLPSHIGDYFVPSLAAGFDHFSVGYMRSWGRDTTIALPGLLFTTGRFEEAKEVLIGHAMSVRHGLVPNLIDSCNHPRFNARDATWYFLRCVVEYCNHAPNGHQILQSPVWRLFPSDGGAPRESTMVATIQEILTAHARGISFRELNAGPQIDSRMRDEGFNIRIHRDPKTGFLHGGNRYNCGTWMDFMGCSDKYDNRGIPSTPRDGAPVEIVGAMMRVLVDLAKLHKEGLYPYDGVDDLSFAEWADQLRRNFHRCFYVPEDESRDGEFVIDRKYVNKRGIYKDVLGATQPWEDYQLRPNFFFAMAYAPELFEDHIEEARRALEIGGKTLKGVLGMKTLDPSDWAYRPEYIQDDNGDPKASYGVSYHCGPEWVFNFGYYLQALVRISGKSRGELESLFDVLLAPHKKVVAMPPWHSLPELTNSDGRLCPPSCVAQAWSVGTILEALYLLENMK